MKEFKSVVAAFPGVDTYWDYSLNKVNPDNVAHRSNKEFFWKCLKGHPSYLCSPDKRIYRNYGCPICSNYKVVAGINDFKSQYPDLMLDWDWINNYGINPEELSKRSIKVVFWKCHICGHEWQARISNREHGRGCPKCAGYKLYPGYNDLATIHPELLEEWDYSKNIDINPSFIHHGSTKKVWWKCKKCGYEYQAPIARRDKGSGCRKCADKANSKMMKQYHQTKKK